MPKPNDTITAQATAPGRGGIAIVRVSGPKVKDIALSITGKQLPPRQAIHTPFQNTAGEIIDLGIAIYYPQPNSFTGEEVLELQGHGGPIVVDLLLQRVLALGARLAQPGEFSERAFLNGKLDLAQAEGIADLINAASQEAARAALRSLQGEFSTAIYALNEKLIYLRMYVEAAIDFTDEEIDFLSDKKITEHLQIILRDLSIIQNKAKQGSLLREGITVVIAGEPNVGKSSLLNALSGKEVAIVTDIPGTTRDVLREYILIDGLPIHIVDTAGLRDSEDIVEQEGIRRAKQQISQADLVLYVLDASKMSKVDMSKLDHFTQPVIVLRNKIDLINANPNIDTHDDKKMISLSARSGQGLDLLKNEIKKIAGFDTPTEGNFLARRRHLDALAKAYAHVENSFQQTIDLAAEELRLAQKALGEIVGEFTTDDLLGRIFASFCVGK